MGLKGRLRLLRAEKVGIPKLTFQVQVKNYFGAHLTVLGAHADGTMQSKRYGHVSSRPS